jgi:Spy/CpxP family protein refolding chaperone
MRERFKTILLIFSLSINFGILGFLAYSLATSYLQEKREKVVFPEEVTSLSRPQAEEIVRARRNLMPSLMEKREKIQTKREELIGLLKAPLPDRQAVKAKLREVSQIQESIQEAALDQMLLETEKMTPDQKETYFNTIRDRMCQRGMMGMPGGGPRCGRRGMMGR